MYTISEIREYINQAIAILIQPKEPHGLYEPTSYIMSIGGKRIRPMLCMLSYNMFKDSINDEALLPAIGIEIFHTFTLVHDDIMDNASTRRNRPTVHHRWNVNTAILSGDVMCIAAYNHLCHANIEHIPKILQLFNRTAAQVCEGQQSDIDYENRHNISEKEYLQMIELKTAVLIAASAAIGALAGGAMQHDVKALYEFGHWVGLAFQIQDDLLDTYGDTNVFGKHIGNDIVQNKKTFLLMLAMQQATSDDRNRLTALLADKQIAREDKIRETLEIYRHLDVQRQAKERIAKYFDNAAMALDMVSVESKCKHNIRQFTESFVERRQ